jgi:hypothetical protein
MDNQHPLPEIARNWLTSQGFQIMPLRATRPWPGDNDYWIEASVTGTTTSPITFTRATQGQATGKRGRHTAYCGDAIEVKRDATVDELETAYQHFLHHNQAANAGLTGLHKHPLPSPMAERASPAVKNKKGD